MSGCSGPVATNDECDVERRRRRRRRSRSDPVLKQPDDDDRDLYTCERIVVTFVQLKNYLGSYWLAPWFFVYVYPSVLAYESHSFAGPFVYCNIIQILFFIVFEFWDESFNWTPLHDTIKTYSSQILGRQYITKNIDESILFCIWVLSWAAVPTMCFINGHIFELPTDRLERLTSYVSMITVTFALAYIFILLWIDMNLLKVKSSVFKYNANTTGSLSKSEFIDDSIQPDDIPDLETMYEDISITSDFEIDNTLLEISGTVNENIGESDEPCNYIKIERGQEITEQDMDVISLSSSTLSDFDVITEEELNFLKE